MKHQYKIIGSGFMIWALVSLAALVFGMRQDEGMYHDGTFAAMWVEMEGPDEVPAQMQIETKNYGGK